VKLVGDRKRIKASNALVSRGAILREEYVSGLKTERSRNVFERSFKIIPGGASSNPRCYPIWDPYPLVLKRGKGSRVWDVDGNEYIDYKLALGPLILGHCPKSVVEAVERQLQDGTMFGTLTEREVEVAEKIHRIVPCAEMVKFATTGAEATLYAIRLARAYTGRDKILKFEGHYHGSQDYMLSNTSSAPVSALGSPSRSYIIPGSWGIPQETLRTVISIPWNDSTVLEKTIRDHRHELAAVITEPVMMNVGTIPPEDGYLQRIRELTEQNEIVMILDEIISGFRLAPGGAQEVYAIKPDLATYAKALAAGFPISAVAGRRCIMENAQPGRASFSGTYHANPICIAAADATLDELTANDCAAYGHLKKIGLMLQDGLEKAVRDTHAQAIVQGVGAGGLQIYFTKLKRIRNYREFPTCDFRKYLAFHKELIKRGVYTHPGQNEHWFVSTAHSEDDIAKTLDAVRQALVTLG
jgi:glutamate-1-semialdehyde 2,1-aminomutase